MTKKEKKAADNRINRAYSENCGGIQIDIMDITKIFNVGREALASGVDDDQLVNVVTAYVETIRKN